jgi:hypothetical protein
MWFQINAGNFYYTLTKRLHAVHQMLTELTRNFTYLIRNILCLTPEMQLFNFILFKNQEFIFSKNAAPWIWVKYNVHFRTFYWRKLSVSVKEAHCEQRFFFYFVQWPTNAQLIDKLLYCSYVFRHYCVILRNLVVSILPSYTIMSMRLLVV